jgi:hypothetical protein
MLNVEPTLAPPITACGLVMPQFLELRRLAYHGRQKVVSSLNDILVEKFRLHIFQS